MNQKTFRLTFKAIVYECSVIFLGIYGLGLSIFIGFVAFGIANSEKFGSINPVISAISSFLALLMAIPSIALLLMPIGRAIFSYLLLSDEGMEFRLWPVHRIRCKWEDIDQIKKSFLPFQGDILMLKKADVSGFHLLPDFNKGNFGVIKTLPMIPLYQIKGWPNGILENELRKYAPALFTNQASEKY